MRLILDVHSIVQSTIVGSKSAIVANTPSNMVYIDVNDDTFAQVGDYYDTVTSTALTPPTSYHKFDANSRQWVDTMPLDIRKDNKWNILKSERDAVEFGGFTYAGNVYDSDQVAQGRIIGAASAGVDQVWTLADNTAVQLTGAELRDLYVALQVHVANAHARGRGARQELEAASTVDEVDAITF